jgi:small subunit ribosomal protein S18
MAKKIEVNSVQIDYKNLKLLKQFITRYGKIVARQYTKVSLKDQKKISRAIKNARYMALVPYVK